MSYHSRECFDKMVVDLGARLQVATSTFITGHGFKFDLPSLSQMQVSLDQVSRELLMFGADAWPEEKPGRILALCGVL